MPRRSADNLRVRYWPVKIFQNADGSYRIEEPLPPGDSRKERPRHRRRTLKEAEYLAALLQTKCQWSNVDTMNISRDVTATAGKWQAKFAPYSLGIEDACRSFWAILQQTKGMTIEKAVEQRLEAKKAAGLSARYLQELRQHLTKFATHFKGRDFGSITAPEIEKYIFGMAVNSVSKNKARSLIHGLFSKLESNPVRRVDRAKVTVVKTKPVTASELKKIIKAVTPQLIGHNWKWMMRALAIWFCTGMRRTEVERLTEDRIRSREIEISGVVKTTASERDIPIDKQLAAWLESFPKQGKMVCPPNWKPLLTRLRAKVGRHAFRKNAFRKTVGSCLYALGWSAGEVCRFIGESRESTFFKSYHAKLKPGPAKAYKAVYPSVVKAEKLRELPPPVGRNHDGTWTFGNPGRHRNYST